MAERFTVEPELIGDERLPTVALVFTSDPRARHMLSPDEATALANRLTDAADEIELAEAVETCDHQGSLPECIACCPVCVEARAGS